MQNMTRNARLTELIAAGHRLVEELVPVLPVQPYRKEPVPGPDGSWLILSDSETVDGAIRDAFSTLGDMNLGAIVGGERGSSVVVVDVDGADAWPKLRQLGVNSGAPVWISRTPRGAHIFFRVPDSPLKRVVQAGGLHLDFLVNGFAVVPPSRTGKGAYHWVSGHSPSDISIVDLAYPPTPLLEWWLSLSTPHILGPRDEGQEKGRVWRLLTEPILEGARNATLTRIGGWLRLYHPEPVVAELLQAINDSRCQPPLDPREIEAIAKSLGRYPTPGADGHPKAVVPYFFRGEAPHE